MTDIAVIIVNYNTASYTVECIEKVQHFTNKTLTYEIIVVDNNSEFDDYVYLEKNIPKQPNISLHRSPVNTGFGGGNMHGEQFANAKYLLFLNNDAMLLNDGLGILKKYMDAHPSVGVCTAQNYDKKNAFVPSFDHNKGLRRLLFGRGFLEKSNPKKYPKRKFEYEQPVEVDWVNGAFLFFNAKAFAQAGKFDTNIFLYFEEMDICHRLRKQGYSSMLVPDAKILHYQGVSTGSSKVINTEAYISYLRVIRKNYGFGKLLIIKLYLTFVFLLKPKKWYLLPIMLSANPQKLSLKNKQKPRIFDTNGN